MTNSIRVILSLLAVVVYVVVNFTRNSVSTLLVAQQAGGQLTNSDSAYVQSIAGMQLAQHWGISLFVLLAVLGVIWWKNIKNMLALGAIGIIVVGTAVPAHAYYDKTNLAEPVTILPNETAFWIPDVGDNKDSQVQFESVEYYEQARKRVPLKRFLIPHQILPNSTGWYTSDYYVPSGRLIIVDRTKYSREWVDAADRGSSAKKEGFPCQSKEGLNITAGVSIGVSVAEKDAAAFLYHFGVISPPAGSLNRSDPATIFRSVYEGQSLIQVMDGVDRRKVQTLVCNEIGKLSFDDANDQMIGIMTRVESSSREFFTGVGITLDFIGWGDTFTFDPEVQASINHRYAARQQALALHDLQPYVGVITTIATADALRNFTTVGKDGRIAGSLPQSLTNVGLPPEIGTVLGALFKAAPTPPPAK